jgi:hypothetical protein
MLRAPFRPPEREALLRVMMKPLQKARREQRRKFEAYLDRSHGECFLRDPPVCKAICSMRRL